MLASEGGGLLPPALAIYFEYRCPFIHHLVIITQLLSSSLKWYERGVEIGWRLAFVIGDACSHSQQP